MEVKTSDSYQKEILFKYKKEKGGEMSMYLAQPTSSQIRQACIWLLDKRNQKHDEYVLKRFFQFKNPENRLNEIQNFDEGKFKTLVNFLNGKTKKTSPKNLELISWLIDFQPRPLQEYLKSENIIPVQNGIVTTNIKRHFKENKKVDRNKNEEESLKVTGRKNKRKWMISISISIAFGAILVVSLISNNHSPFNNKSQLCMTWADSLYIEISCNEGPLSAYGTQVKPLDQMEIKNMRKVKVNAAYQFFSEDGKPMIWYYKNKEKEYEFFTSPGLHPVNGETLRKITPYIIQSYVPMHINEKSSFVP